MEYKKSIILIILTIFLLSIAGVCASDVNDTLVTSEDNTEIELSQSDETDEISVTDDSPVIEQSNNEEKLTAGNTWYVNSSAANGAGTLENPFNNLNDALDASGDNDIIKIASGTYAGENNTYLIINKNLTFERYGDGDVIFDGGNTNGIWEIQAKSINITGLTFQNGYGGNGGALSFKSELINSNINANFNNNRAMSSGGAIHFSEALTNVNITGNFTKNNAKGYSYDGEGGGAICFLAELNHVNIIGDFTDNIAQSFAGANYFKSNIANVNIYGNYKNNSAIEQNGGANWFMALENVTITGNFTNNIALGFGGANVFSEELKNVNIIGNFINNTASWNNGGANQFKEKLTNVAITGDYSYNKAKQNGGANWFNDDKALDNVNITGNYDHNEAGQDGGANRLGKPVNVNIIGNYTSNSAKNTGSWNGGGAIYVQNDPTKITIAGNFYNNVAVSQGAVICFYNSMKNVDMTGCFINNTGTSVIYCWGTSNSIIHDSIFLNNSKITCDGSGTLKIIDTWFGNNATNYDVAPDENKIDFDNWLFLNATVDSNIDDASKISNIIFKLYSYNASGVSDYNNNLLNPNLTITATNGNVSKNIAKLGENIQFTPTKGGTATVTATVENAHQTVDIQIKGDFDLLQDLVNNESLSLINLERNYTYNDFDTMAEGVRITRTITINGNGYTIDAKGKSRIFYIEAENVGIENITFKNANINDGNGGAIFFSKSGSVTNCNFTNNSATYNGGAVNFGKGGTVANCNFTNNSATHNGGAVNFDEGGTVANCDFVNNSAFNYGGAVCFFDDTNGGEVTNCTFTNNNNAIVAGAIFFKYVGAVTKCDFVNNSAYFTGGAIDFEGVGSVSNCNFTNNQVIGDGGAVYFNKAGDVTNCNFTDNKATIGSAIDFNKYSSYTLTISNSTFLNNRANVDDNTPLNVTINENNITITFMGQDNLLNAIYSKDNGEVTFNNVTYWGANGITTISSTKSGSHKEAGQNITIAVVVNDKLVFNDVKVTDENGTIVLDISASENYYISARHDEDSYYTEAEKTISNMKFYVNVTETETTNKTVNITAKSNIHNEVMPGKLLFIILNSDPINATYGGNGTWWAVYTFDYYAVYEVNATYIGLDNVTVNNATISISKTPTEITLVNETVNLFVEDSIDSGAALTPAVGNLTFTSNNESVAKVEDGNIIAVGGGSAVITVSFAGGDDYAPAKNKTISVTVSKIPTNISVNTVSLDLSVGDEAVIVASLTPADAGNVTFTSSDENVVLIDDDEGNIIAYCNGRGQANITVSFAGSYKYAAVNKTISVTVRLNNANVTVDKDTLDLKVDETYAINATKHPDTILLDINYTSSNNSVASVDKNGIVTAVGEGTAIITLSVGDDEIYAKNSTNVTVTVSKVPTEINVLNDTLVLAVTDEIDIGATLTPPDAGNLTYSISNSSVVKIEDGKIIALAEGKSTITVSFEGDKKYLEAENKTIDVAIRLNDAKVTAENITIYVNENNTIEAMTTPSGLKLIYESANSTVACVDDTGKVTGKTEGTTTITITIDGEGIYYNNKTTISVTVKKATLKLTAKAKTFKDTDKNKIYTVVLKDDKGNAFENAFVSLKVNGKTYSAISDKDGVATFYLKKLTKTGTFTAIVTFPGDNYYNNATAKAKIKIKVTWKTIAKGSKKKVMVKKIQKALKKHGYYLKYKGHYLKIDGIFNTFTQKAVKQFQKSKGLKVTGKVDYKTAQKLKIVK